MCIICAIYSVDNKLKDEPKPKKKPNNNKKISLSGNLNLIAF